MKYDPFTRFIRNDDPDDLGGGAGEDTQVDDTDDTVEDDDDSTENRIANMIEEGFKRIAPAPAAPVAQPQMTEAEVKKALKVFEADETLAQEFREAMAAEHGSGKMRAFLNKMFRGQAEQHTTMAQLLAAKNRQDIDLEYAPVKTYLTTQQREAKQKAFYKEYPELKAFDPGLISAAAAKVSATEVQGKSEKEIRQILAKKVEATIKTVKPDFTLSQAKSGGTNARPASVSSGGHGGGGATKGKTGGASGIWD